MLGAQRKTFSNHGRSKTTRSAIQARQYTALEIAWSCRPADIPDKLDTPAPKVEEIVIALDETDAASTLYRFLTTISPPTVSLHCAVWEHIDITPGERKHHSTSSLLCDPRLISYYRRLKRTTLNVPFDSLFSDKLPYPSLAPWTDEPIETRLRQFRLVLVKDWDMDGRLRVKDLPPLSALAHALLNIGGSSCDYKVSFASNDEVSCDISALIQSEIEVLKIRTREHRKPGWSMVQKPDNEVADGSIAV